MARDSQRAKVYAWEKIAYPGYLTDRLLTDMGVRHLVRRVHDDVNRAGGIAALGQTIKFTKRAGGACASWGNLNFTPRKTSIYIALHEIAHSLTWNPRLKDSVYETKSLADHARQHFQTCLDNQGHGPKYVACMLALIEKYAGNPAAPAVNLARYFKYEAWGSFRRVAAGKTADGRTIYALVRQKEMKVGSVEIDHHALWYWRDLLAPVS